MGKVQKNDFDISGKVLWVGMPVEIPGTNSLMKRTVVIEGWVDNKFKQEFAFDFVNENMDKLNNVRTDDWVNISFHLRGRKHIQGDGKARWYTNLEGTDCIVDHD
jgi:hypothetical protein